MNIIIRHVQCGKPVRRKKPTSSSNTFICHKCGDIEITVNEISMREEKQKTMDSILEKEMNI